MNIQLTTLFILNILFNSMASFLIKIGMSRIVQSSAKELIFAMIMSPYIVLGGVCFAVGFLVYTLILQKSNLAMAYPIVTSGSMICIVFLSVFILKQPLKFQQVMGIFLILTGINFIVR